MSNERRIPWRIAVGCSVDLCGLAGLALAVWGTATSQVLIISLTLLVTTLAGYCCRPPLEVSPNAEV
ncbi:hypothetical protein [Flindersiella endophytica]